MAISLELPAQKNNERRSFSRLADILEVPNLVKVQLESYRWFREEGLERLLSEISPIRDLTEKRFELSFVDPKTGKPRYQFKEPEHSLEECRQRDLTYACPLYVTAWLTIKETGEIKEHTLYMGNLPQMTPWGTLVINGAERVVVSQLLRSPGAYFTRKEDPASGQWLGYATLIPDRGAWLEFETSPRSVLWMKVDGKRRILITTFLKALGYPEEEVLRLLQEGEEEENPFLRATLAQGALEKEEVHTPTEALLAIFRKLRPGDPPNVEDARSLLHNLVFNPRRYDLSTVGRYKLNLKLGRDLLVVWGMDPRVVKEMGREEVLDRVWLLQQPTHPSPAEAEQFRQEVLKMSYPEAVDRLRSLLPGLEEEKRSTLGRPEAEQWAREHYSRRVLTPQDLVAMARYLIRVNQGRQERDDIDHLGNRRVRTIGELVQNQFRIGLMRLERVVRDRMSVADPKVGVIPSSLVNIRPVVAAIKEFFGGSQLSQFMDQTNPVAELTHKRRLSAMGPGGLSRERAGFEVRDVHPSHYGRICPIETPEGPNIGLIGSLATYSRVNRLGFIETPVRRVHRELENTDPRLVGRTVRERVKNTKGRVVAEAGMVVTPELFKSTLRQLARQKIPVVPFAAAEVEYLSADQEEDYIIAQPHSQLNQRGEFREGKVEVRHRSKYYLESPLKVDCMDVSPKQIVSVTTSLIPFLEHDDANRALMGSNMQRQAVPLVCSQAPTIGTGMERVVARDSGQMVTARRDGVVASVTSRQVQVLGDDGTLDTFPLVKFVRTNQGTCVTQRPIVSKGQRVVAGQVLADSYSTYHGELALGQNVLVAFMSWEGYNFEDAIVFNESLVQEDKFTSVHIERYDVEARETKLGYEEITRDIPNVGEEALRHLDEDGIIRIGAEVVPGDILVGKITPKGETELSPEEKLLRAIFGEQARDVKDTSLRVPHGEAGKVIAIRVLSREQGHELPAGVIKMVRIWLAQKRKVTVGDKIAGRHGNKGVISRILPPADMPFLPDGRPVEVILNPIGVPSRMNLGQILETHLGAAAHTLGYQALCPVFDGARSEDIEEALAQAWLVQRAGAINPRTGQAELERAREWLAQRGYDASRALSADSAGEARRLSLRVWLEDVGIEPRPLSDAAVEKEAERLVEEKGLFPPTYGKLALRDGRTGEPFDQPITVGYIYLMKLIHLVEDKVNARSTGPYSLITQQPLGGKAQFGGQRFGEMEVWALEAYGASYNLQELLTVKSDDVQGRSHIYEAIVKGEEVLQPGLPESFKVLVRELMSLGLAVEVLNEEERASSAEESLEHRRLSADL